MAYFLPTRHELNTSTMLMTSLFALSLKYRLDVKCFWSSIWIQIKQTKVLFWAGGIGYMICPVVFWLPFDYFLVTLCLSRFVAAAVRHLNMVRSHAPYTKPKPHYLWSLAKCIKCMTKRDTRLTYTLKMKCLSGGFWYLNLQNVFLCLM